MLLLLQLLLQLLLELWLLLPLLLLLLLLLMPLLLLLLLLHVAHKQPGCQDPDLTPGKFAYLGKNEEGANMHCSVTYATKWEVDSRCK